MMGTHSVLDSRVQRWAPDVVPVVAIVDDHLLLVETVQSALRARGLRTLAFTPGPPAELLRELIVAAPDLVLLDLDLGIFGDSTVMIPSLVAAGLQVLIVTGVADRLRIAAALEQGAIGCQSKGAGFDALLDAASAALTATGPLNPTERASLLRELGQVRVDDARSLAPFQSLTAREVAALKLLCDGMSVTQIAGSWVVSEATVRSHVQRILSKLGVGSQVQAVALALRSGWLGD